MIMRRWPWLVAACALALAALLSWFVLNRETPDTLAQIRTRGSLVCGVATGARPFGFVDAQSRQLTGYDVDICKAVARRLGVSAHPVAVSVEQRIAELNSGRIDLLVAVLGWTPDRARQIDYSHRYFVSRQMVIARSGNGISTLADLAGRKISAAKGSTAEQYLRVRAPEAQLLTFQDAPSAFLALSQGKVDAMAVSDLAAIQFARQSDFGFAAIDEPLKVEPWGLAVRKGQHAMLAEVNDALDAVEASGEAAEIFWHWFGPGTDFAQQRSFKFGPIDAGPPGAGGDRPSVSLLRDPFPSWLLYGALTTLQLFVYAWLIAFTGGLGLTILRASPVRWAENLVAAYVELTRNIPLLAQVMFWYFAVPVLLPASMQAWIIAHDGEFLLATLALGFALAGYFSEAMRSGVRAVPRTQIEAGRALGFSFFATMRHVILPQALRFSVPPLVNNTVLLFQNTSIALAIGVHELMYQTRAIDNETYRTVEIFAVATLIYLAGSALLVALGSRFERPARQAARQ